MRGGTRTKAATLASTAAPQPTTIGAAVSASTSRTRGAHRHARRVRWVRRAPEPCLRATRRHGSGMVNGPARTSAETGGLGADAVYASPHRVVHLASGQMRFAPAPRPFQQRAPFPRDSMVGARNASDHPAHGTMGTRNVAGIPHKGTGRAGFASGGRGERRVRRACAGATGPRRLVSVHHLTHGTILPPQLEDFIKPGGWGGTLR